jgi:hypothetical protein
VANFLARRFTAAVARDATPIVLCQWHPELPVRHTR